MVSGARARDVEQVSFRVIDLLEVRIVADGLDSFLKRDDLVVAGHHDHRAELEALGKVHSSDREMAARGCDVLVENLEGHACFPDCCLRSIELCLGADKY